MSDGKRVDLKSCCASDAIQRALENFPGRKVIDCFTGYREDHIAVSSSGSMHRGPEWIDYEIPVHNPLPADWFKTKKETGPETETFGFLADIPVNER